MPTVISRREGVVTAQDRLRVAAAESYGATVAVGLIAVGVLGRDRVAIQDAGDGGRRKPAATRVLAAAAWTEERPKLDLHHLPRW